MCKSIAEPGRRQMTIWCMRIVYWIPKATNTYSDYVILIAFLVHEWFHELASVSPVMCNYLCVTTECLAVKIFANGYTPVPLCAPQRNVNIHPVHWISWLYEVRICSYMTACQPKFIPSSVSELATYRNVTRETTCCNINFSFFFTYSVFICFAWWFLR